MFRVCPKRWSPHIKTIILFSCSVAFALLVPATSQAQRSNRSLDSPDDNPPFQEFRGVQLGMAAEEVRKKLGTPEAKDPTQDFCVFNETETVVIYYDKNGAVNSLSVDFMSGAKSVPTAKDVLGTEPEAKSDGSIHKLVSYPKAGYWVSYTRTAGKNPLVTITMAKLP